MIVIIVTGEAVVKVERALAVPPMHGILDGEAADHPDCLGRLVRSQHVLLDDLGPAAAACDAGPVPRLPAGCRAET